MVENACADDSTADHDDTIVVLQVLVSAAGGLDGDSVCLLALRYKLNLPISLIRVSRFACPLQVLGQGNVASKEDPSGYAQ